jgi:hypothetical protein
VKLVIEIHGAFAPLEESKSPLPQLVRRRIERKEDDPPFQDFRRHFRNPENYLLPRPECVLPVRRIFLGTADTRRNSLFPSPTQLTALVQKYGERLQGGKLALLPLLEGHTWKNGFLPGSSLLGMPKPASQNVRFKECKSHFAFC